MGYALVFIVILMTVLFFGLSKLAVKENKYQMMAKGHVTSSLKRPAWWGSTIIYAASALVVFVALIPHITVIITSISDKWFMTPFLSHTPQKYFSMVFQQELSSIGIKNSLFFASISTLIDLVLGVLVAYVVARKLVPFSGWLMLL